MRILFATDAVDQVSAQLNAPNYAKLNELEGVSIDFYNRNYTEYDVVLFMGYDARVAEARAAKPALKIGVIDLRPSSLKKSLGADFVIANGVEMQDWLSAYFENIFIYPIYPLIKAPLKVHTQRRPLIIGYHGNKVHLMGCVPKVSAALEMLSVNHEIEFWAVYDIEKLGNVTFPMFKTDKLKVRYFQWSEDVYEKIISQVDMGIVPSVIPMKNEASAKKQVEPFSTSLQPHETDFLLRFKNTSNAGRIYVFSQLGIPVVAGMSPSAAQAIQHGRNGFLANSTEGWYRALRSLTVSTDLRTQMGLALYEDFNANVSPALLNAKLVDFISALRPGSGYWMNRFADSDKKITRASQNDSFTNHPLDSNESPLIAHPSENLLSDQRDRSLTIIIPAFNEAGSIGQVLKDIQKTSLHFVESVILIDDGSTDDTLKIARGFDVQVVRHSRRLGYGAALKSGIKESHTEFVVFMDADGQHLAKDILSLWEKRLDNDMVIGQRSRSLHSPMWRMPGKWLLWGLANYLTQQKILDLNSGFRLMRRDVALKYLHLCPSGFSFSTTMTMALLTQGYSVAYAPIEINKRVGKSTVTVATGLNTIVLILRLASLFNPLRVFLPMSFFLCFAGVIYAIPYALAGRGISIGALLAMVTSSLVFILGLLCDQISQLRLERYE